MSSVSLCCSDVIDVWVSVTCVVIKIYCILVKLLIALNGSEWKRMIGVISDVNDVKDGKRWMRCQVMANRFIPHLWCHLLLHFAYFYAFMAFKSLTHRFDGIRLQSLATDRPLLHWLRPNNTWVTIRPEVRAPIQCPSPARAVQMVSTQKRSIYLNLMASPRLDSRLLLRALIALNIVLAVYNIITLQSSSRSGKSSPCVIVINTSKDSSNTPKSNPTVITDFIILILCAINSIIVFITISSCNQTLTFRHRKARSERKVWGEGQLETIMGKLIC